MIYLMRTYRTYLGVYPSEDCPYLALKVGYTNSNRKKDRLDDYKTHGLNGRYIKLIPDGTLKTEKRVHKYLRSKKYYVPDCLGQKEWYLDLNEIYELFYSCDDDYQLNKELTRLENIEKSREKTINKYLNLGKKSKIDDENLQILYYILSTKDVYRPEFIYNLKNDEQLKEAFKEAFEILPSWMSDPIDLLGIDRYKQLNYDEFLIDLEVFSKKSMIPLSDIVIEIQNQFNCKSYYNKIEIKNKLDEVYKSIGYQRRATVTDILRFFSCNHLCNPQVDIKLGDELISCPKNIMYIEGPYSIDYVLSPRTKIDFKEMLSVKDLDTSKFTSTPMKEKTLKEIEEEIKLWRNR